MASTIRHNRARGMHSLELMTGIVAELSKSGMSDSWIMRNIGTVSYTHLDVYKRQVGSQAISPYATMGLMSATAYNFGTNSNFTGYWANDIAVSYTHLINFTVSSFEERGTITFWVGFCKTSNEGI